MSFNRRTLNKDLISLYLDYTFDDFNLYLTNSDSYSYEDKFSQTFHNYFISLNVVTREELFNYLKINKCK